MLFGPSHNQGFTGNEHYDNRLTGSFHRLQQVQLLAGQIQRGEVESLARSHVLSFRAPTQPNTTRTDCHNGNIAFPSQFHCCGNTVILLTPPIATVQLIYLHILAYGLFQPVEKRNTFTIVKFHPTVITCHAVITIRS